MCACVCLPTRTMEKKEEKCVEKLNKYGLCKQIGRYEIGDDKKKVEKSWESKAVFSLSYRTIIFNPHHGSILYDKRKYLSFTLGKYEMTIYG